MRKNLPQYRFLLVSSGGEEQWSTILRNVVNPWGTLDVVTQKDAVLLTRKNNYALIIVDWGAASNVAQFVSDLRTGPFKPSVLVVAASLTWQAAREVLKAGAIDYVVRSFEPEELHAHIEKILGQPTSDSSMIEREYSSTIGRNILFADNAPAFLKVRREFLEEEGYHVISATNPAEARAFFQRGDIDLAILDIRLEDNDDEKDTSGLALAEEVTRSVPVIILTAYPNVDAVRAAFVGKFGELPAAVEFLSKEEGANALVQAVGRILGAKE